MLPDGSKLLVLVSSRAVIQDSQDQPVLSPATIVISKTSGRIVDVRHEISPSSEFPDGTEYVDKSPLILMPGIVDAHVHLNEPGRTEWEGFWTGTRAAAAGGVTTVVDMPLNAIPPTTTIRGLEEKINAAEGQCWVDVGFYGGVIPGNADQLLPLVKAGVRGFKCFMIDSGVEEFPAVSSLDIRLAMHELKNTPVTLMFHAEMIPPITDSIGDDVQTSLPPLAPHGPLNAYQTFLESRPPAFETYAIDEVIAHAHLAPNLKLHIVHLSSVEAIPILRKAREEGVKIVAETCFHYLSLAADRIKEGDTRHKCCPPIRDESNRVGLWEELQRKDSVIRTIVSDHSPCTPNLKILPAHLHDESHGDCLAKDEKDRGDFFTAWGGISSVGLGLPILWTCKPSNISILDVVKWCCINTAAQVGLSGKKGKLAPGMDADICIFDDEGRFVLDKSRMLFRNKVSPYQGLELHGVVKETWLRGRSVYTRGRSHEGFGENDRPMGVLLLEEVQHDS